MTTYSSQLLDLDTFVQVKKAAPKVTTVPFNIACYVVRAMAEISKSRTAHIDSSSQLYWQVRVKEIFETGKFGDEVSINHVGRALKALGLESWRKMDGYYAAWSLSQLEILQKHFKA